MANFVDPKFVDWLATTARTLDVDVACDVFREWLTVSTPYGYPSLDLPDAVPVPGESESDRVSRRLREHDLALDRLYAKHGLGTGVLEVADSPDKIDPRDAKIKQIEARVIELDQDRAALHRALREVQADLARVTAERDMAVGAYHGCQQLLESAQNRALSTEPEPETQRDRVFRSMREVRTRQQRSGFANLIEVERFTIREMAYAAFAIDPHAPSRKQFDDLHFAAEKLMDLIREADELANVETPSSIEKERDLRVALDLGSFNVGFHPSRKPPFDQEAINAALHAFRTHERGQTPDVYEWQRSAIEAAVEAAALAQHITPSTKESTMTNQTIMNGDHAEFEMEWAGKDPKTRPDWPLPSFDARDWAAAFVKTIGEKPEIATDEGTMLAWFSGALMRGFDEGRTRVP